MSEFLKVGAPAEISPLFTFKTVGMPHHPRVSSWPLRSTGGSRFRGGCGPEEGGYFEMSEIAQRVGMSLCVVGASFCHSLSFAVSAISGMLSVR